MLAKRLARWLDDRLGGARLARATLDKVFPDHWSFMLGEIAIYAFVVIVLTGLYLTFFFSADSTQVVYDGPYAPLHGAEMSAAYESVLNISFQVKAGLLMRQMHHWGALVFLAAIVLHMARVFFTGAFRKPRELNWMIGATLLTLAIAAGFTGYSLPDDLLSGTGLRIMFSIVLSIPFIGPWLAFLIFGGNFPGTEIIGRLLPVHILLIPVIIAGVLVVHLGVMIRQKHTNMPGQGASNTRITGTRFYPTFMAQTIGLFFITAAVIALLGGFFQINPVWIWGPFDPVTVSAGSQPDWYVGWMEGALRLYPHWEPVIFGVTIPEPFIPGVVLAVVTFGAIYAWPFLEARVTGDHEVHHVDDRPRDRPVRTAIGAAVAAFYLVLFVAGANDIIAEQLDLSVNSVTWTLRIALFVLPVVVFFLTRQLARELGARSREGPEVRIDRDEGGGFTDAEVG
jgi:quinol---cytochrome-c reductase cytochrome b subunit